MKPAFIKKVKSYREIEAIAKKLKRQRKTIAFAIGSFDLLHLGHSLFFDQAKRAGDILIIGVGTDQALRTLKGNGRPIYPEKVRAYQIAAQQSVDYVVILKEKMKPNKNNYSMLLKKIQPHYFVVNDDDSAITAKKGMIRKHGGTAILVSRERPRGIPYISTTGTYENIKKFL